MKKRLERIKKHLVEKQHHYKLALLFIVLFAIFFFAHQTGNKIPSETKPEEIVLTPLEDFFSVQKGPIPEVDVKDWNLKVTGLVDKPFTMTYDEIVSSESVTEVESLMCVQDPERLFARGNWTGVKVKDLLDKAGVKPGVRTVIFRAVDGYSSSLELSDVTDDVILAYEVNGETLPAKIGYPLIVVVPGRWGYKWVKWVDTVELASSDYKGFWESRGYDYEALIPAEYLR